MCLFILKIPAFCVRFDAMLLWKMRMDTCKNMFVHTFLKWLVSITDESFVNQADWSKICFQIKYGSVIIVSIQLHNRTGGVMVSVLAFECDRSWIRAPSGQTKDYEIGICCFSTKNSALRSRSKDWLDRNQDNVSKWSDMSMTHGLLFQCSSIIKIQFSMLV